MIHLMMNQILDQVIEVLDIFMESKCLKNLNKKLELKEFLEVMKLSMIK